jgi:hypothetical protein
LLDQQARLQGVGLHAKYPMGVRQWKYKDGSFSEIRHRAAEMHVTCTFSYTEQDRYPQGGNTDIAFRLYHWPMMDLFIYFRYLLNILTPLHSITQ